MCVCGFMCKQKKKKKKKRKKKAGTEEVHKTLQLMREDLY